MRKTMINATYAAALNDVEELKTPNGNIKIRDKKLLIKLITAEDPHNTLGHDYFFFFFKMTAANRVITPTENGFSVTETPELFGNYRRLTLETSMKDMHEAIEACIKECIKAINKHFGQPTEA